MCVPIVKVYKMPKTELIIINNCAIKRRSPSIQKQKLNENCELVNWKVRWQQKRSHHNTDCGP